MSADVDGDGVLTNVREIDGCTEHESIIWSATVAICVSVVSGNAASTVWTTDGIFSKNISLKKADSTWSPPTKHRIRAGIERVSHLQGFFPHNLAIALFVGERMQLLF